MSKAALKATRATVYRWIGGQSIVLVVVSLIFLQLKGKLWAVSVLWGGAFCIIPTALFARSWLSYFRASAARRLVNMFYMGSMAKLFAMGALFLISQWFLHIDLLGCLIGFVTAQLALWITPLFSTLLSSRVFR